MSGPPLGFHDTFTEQGLWWRRGYEEDKVGGTLSFDPIHGVTLKLLGIFGDLVGDLFCERALCSGGGESSEKQVIYGVTINGKPITLLKSFRKNRQVSMPGIPTESWFANLLIVGIHMDSETDENRFTKSAIRFEGIEKWLGHNAFVTEIDRDTRQVSVTTTQSSPQFFAKHRDFEVHVEGTWHKSEPTASKCIIDVETFLAISPLEARSLDWHFEQTQKLRELASLCAGYDLPLISLKVSGPPFQTVGEKEYPTTAHVFAKMRDNTKQGRDRFWLPIISGPELVRYSPNSLQVWFDQYETLSSTLSLFFTVNANNDLLTNVRFLLAIQALEAFHRQTDDTTILPREDFRKFRDDWIAALPSDAPQEMRDKFSDTAMYSNELSLKMRLASIIKSITDAFEIAPVRFEQSDINQLVDTRNYFTHFNPKLSERSLDGLGMHYGTRRILMLLTILFFRRLDVPATDIKNSLRRHEEFWSLWSDPNIGKQN